MASINDPMLAYRTFRTLRDDRETRGLDRTIRGALGGIPAGAPRADVTQALSGALAGAQGGGQAMLALRGQQMQAQEAQAAAQAKAQDEAEDRFYDLIKDGQVEGARMLAEQHGLPINPKLFADASKARELGLVLDMVKANAHDPQWGGRMIQALEQNGSFAKAISAAGAPQAKKAASRDPQAPTAIREMQAMGLDPTNPQHRKSYYDERRAAAPSRAEGPQRAAVQIYKAEIDAMGYSPDAAVAWQRTIERMKQLYPEWKAPPAPAAATPQPEQEAEAGGWSWPWSGGGEEAVPAAPAPGSTPAPSPAAPAGPQATAGPKQVQVIPGMDPAAMLEQQGVRVGDQFIDDQGQIRTRTR